MAITINASDTAGSAARNARRGEAINGRRAGAMAAAVISGFAQTVVGEEFAHPPRASRDLLERGLDHLFLAELAASEIGDYAAVAEDVDVVAILQFVDFRRVPEEGAAVTRLG